MESRKLNRDVKVALVELAKKNNLESFYLQDGVNTNEVWIIALGVGLFFLSAAGGGGAGWLLAVTNGAPNLSVAWTAVGAAVVGVPIGLVVLRELVTASAPSYEAHMLTQDLPTGRSFSAAAGNEPRTVPLSEDDKRLLQAFALRYPAIRSIAINHYEGSNSPFHWWDNKTEAIKRVHTIFRRMRVIERKGNGYDLTDAGKARIPDWQNGIFDEPAPPSPEDAT